MTIIKKIIVVLLVAAALTYVFYGLYRANAQGLDVTSLSANASVQLSTANTDGGFCSDAEEARYGTDPTSPYDDLFQGPPVDGMISVVDILSVVKHYGANPGEPNYSPVFDRGPGYTAPDGAVSASDILMVIRQYSHRCTDIPWCSGGVYELADEPADVPDGTTSSEVCYAIRDASGAIVNYVVANYDSSKIVTGQVAGMPGDIAGQQGLPTPDGSVSMAGSPYVQYETCVKEKKWRDIFHYNYYSIKIDVDYAVLKDAGVLTDLVKVISDTEGDQGTHWPWDLNGSPVQWTVWYYTGSGPWDGKIIIHRDVPVKATLLGVVTQTKYLHAKMTIGPGDSCSWSATD